jgi:glycoside/pentoside/hexuronide:cation symporter, GPH family
LSALIRDRSDGPLRHGIPQGKETMMDKGEKLSLRVKIGFGAGEFSSSIFWITMAFWLMNYLTDEVGLSAGLAGLAIMAGKALDAFIDPGVGFLSDRTRSAMGRRRPWFLFGAFPFGLAYLLMFTNPRLHDQTAMFLWAAGAFIILCLAYSCANVPYNSLMPELTSDYNERTSLTGYKSIFSVIGTVLGAGAGMPIISSFGNRTSGFMTMGAIFGALIVLSVLTPFFAVREPRRHGAVNSPSILASNRDAFRNRPFVLILAVWTLNTCGITVVTATLIYYFKYLFNNEQLITPASVIMLLTSMAFIPVAVKLSKVLGKRVTYMLGMTGVTISSLLIFLFGHVAGIYAVYGIMFFTGIGLSTHYVLPWAIIPDTIDYDYAESGVRREGVYYGLWMFMIKIGQALAGLFVGLILGIFGYVPDVPQSAGSLLGIRLLVGPITAAFFILGIVILYFYPIDRKRYDEIQERIRAMDGAKG